MGIWRIWKIRITNKHKQNFENLTSMILDTTKRLQIEVNNKMEAEERIGLLQETVEKAIFVASIAKSNPEHRAIPNPWYGIEFDGDTMITNEISKSW